VRGRRFLESNRQGDWGAGGVREEIGLRFAKSDIRGNWEARVSDMRTASRWGCNLKYSEGGRHLHDA
jgi:hypothetical protein